MRVHCKRCSHTLREGDDKLFGHSRKSADCACGCEAQPLEELSYKVIGEGRSRRQADAPPAGEVATSSAPPFHADDGEDYDDEECA